MRLMEYLPEKYEHSRSTVVFQEALQPEVDMLWAARDYFLQQLNPRTANGPGLTLWEDAMGVRSAADADLDQRRGRVIAKLRGMGVVTAELLKAVVESFLVSDVEVTERPRDNWVDLRYSAAGMLPPPDPAGIINAILEILPAHIGLGLWAASEPMEGTAYCAGAFAAYSRTVLTEWRMDQSFTGTINIAGAFAVRSRTGLPPAE